MQEDFEFSPPDDVGLFHFEANDYPELDRTTFQKALQQIYMQLAKDDVPSISAIEEHLRAEEYTGEYVRDGLEFFGLPTHSLARYQCRLDTLEQADEELRAVKDAGGVPNLDAILSHVLGGPLPKYQVNIKCKGFKSPENPEGKKAIIIDFTEELRPEVRKALGMDPQTPAPEASE